MDRWEDQEAVCHWYSLSIPQLRRVLVQHPDQALARRILEAADTYAAPMQEPQSMALPPAVERIILASASPTMVGQVQNLGDSLLGLPRVGERVVPLAELWIWDDLMDDYRVVTNFLPTEDIIWERPNPLNHGDHPFFGLTLGPTPGYIWGICPLEDLIGLQAWQDAKVKDIDTRDDLQLKPPTFFKGMTGITDEMAERFNAPNGLMSSGNPTAEIQRLGQALDDAGDAHLVHHLGDLARARRADQGDRLGVGVGHRLGPVERALLAAAHNRELAALGARLAARHRRIDEVDADLLCRRMQLAGDVGRSRGVVEQDRALRHAGEGAVVAQHHRAQMAVVADAAEYDLLARGRFLRRLRRFALVLLGPGLGLGEGPVVDRHIVALGGEMSRHRKAHHAQTQKRHLGHRSLPRVSLRARS
jgi:hypothetical protein